MTKNTHFFVFAGHVSDDNETPSADNLGSRGSQTWSRKQWLAAHPDMAQHADAAADEARARGYDVAE